jgi:hypothetical protein
MLILLIYSSIIYLNENPYILLLDCTYKSNKWGMPLLNIMGIDSLNKGFTVAIVFLNYETEEDYDWAITQLKNCFEPGVSPSVIITDCEKALIVALDTKFPLVKSILCYWHVNMNMAKNCKPFFATAEEWDLFSKGFQACVYAKTQEEFYDIVKEWKSDWFWNDGNPYILQNPIESTLEEIEECARKEESRLALSYCLGIWLVTYKSKVVHAYIDQSFYGGNTTTSRLEGSHFVLKSWIGPPRRNLTGVWRAVQLAIDHQLSEIRTHRAQQRSTTRIKHLSEFFSEIQGHITPYALGLLYKQWDILKGEPQRLERSRYSSICTGNYQRSIGIPCWHIIKSRIQDTLRIQPLDFHPHWHWIKPLPGTKLAAPQPPILDPITRQRRRVEETAQRAHQRHHATIRRAQTRRILSQHKQVQVVLRHCSACVEWNHDKAICTSCRATSHTRNACPNVPYSRGNRAAIQEQEQDQDQDQSPAPGTQISQFHTQNHPQSRTLRPLSPALGTQISQFHTQNQGPVEPRALASFSQFENAGFNQFIASQASQFSQNPASSQSQFDPDYQLDQYLVEHFVTTSNGFRKPVLPRNIDELVEPKRGIIKALLKAREQELDA